MPSIWTQLRLLLGNHPLERMDRVQHVRDELLETLRAEGYSWHEIQDGAQTAHNQLKHDQLPDRTSNPIEQTIAEHCHHYHTTGYPLPDLRDAVDGVQTKATANQHLQTHKQEN